MLVVLLPVIVSRLNFDSCLLENVSKAQAAGREPILASSSSYLPAASTLMAGYRHSHPASIRYGVVWQVRPSQNCPRNRV
jgi:hypothetical protein